MKSIPLKIYIFVGIFLSMLAGCHNATDSALASADALMDSDPAKAQSILDAIKVDSTDLERRMLHALLKEKAVIKQHWNIESDSMAEVVMRYYEGRKDSLEVLSKLYYGMSLRQHGKYEEAMVPLIFAYDLADRLNEYRSAGLAACELCFIYNRFYVRQDELYWAELQKYQFNKGSLPLHEAWADLDLIEALAHNGRVDEAQHLICYLDSLYRDDAPAFLSQLNLYRPWIEYLQDNPHESLRLYEEALDKGCRIGSNVWLHIPDHTRSLLKAISYREKRIEIAFDSVHQSILYCKNARIDYFQRHTTSNSGPYPFSDYVFRRISVHFAGSVGATPATLTDSGGYPFIYEL